MAYLEFDDSLKVGNKIIDQEHAMLIDYINLLQKSVENEISERLMRDVLGGLVDYAKTHFFVEEELMKAFDYPGSDAHKKAHESFRHKVDELSQAFKEGRTNIGEDVLDFLKEWLTNHILKIDRQLSDFLSDKSMAS